MKKFFIILLVLSAAGALAFLFFKNSEYSVSVERGGGKGASTRGRAAAVAQEAGDIGKNVVEGAGNSITAAKEYAGKQADGIAAKMKGMLASAYDSIATTGKEYLGLSAAPTGSVQRRGAPGTPEKGHEVPSLGIAADEGAAIPQSEATIAQVLSRGQEIRFAPTVSLFESLATGTIYCSVRWDDGYATSASCAKGTRCFSHAYESPGEYHPQFSCAAGSSPATYQADIVVTN